MKKKCAQSRLKVYIQTIQLYILYIIYTSIYNGFGIK